MFVCERERVRVPLCLRVCKCALVFFVWRVCICCLYVRAFVCVSVLVFVCSQNLRGVVHLFLRYIICEVQNFFHREILSIQLCTCANNYVSVSYVRMLFN